MPVSASPPVDAAYHFKPVPVAVSWLTVPDIQKDWAEAIGWVITPQGTFTVIVLEFADVCSPNSALTL